MKTRRRLCDDSDLVSVGAAGATVICGGVNISCSSGGSGRFVRVSSSQAAGTVYTEPNKHGQRVTCPTAIVPLRCGDPGAPS